MLIDSLYANWIIFGFSQQNN